MVIVLKKEILEKDKSDLKNFLIRNNFIVNEIEGCEETIFGAVGKLSIDPREVEILPGVDRVIPISKPYKIASREFKNTDTVVEIKNSFGSSIKVGGLRIASIAGPCAVESESQMMAIAKDLSSSGAVMLRGGAFKPRTSPYAFQGLGEEGLKILKKAGDKYSMPVVTECVSENHIPLMKKYGIDVIQIGARNMQNFELLKAVGRENIPVILKRGISATIEEWLMAAEYLLSSGSENVILCERGIRTYERATRNTLDLSAIPVVKSLTHLPVIVDPSHAVGIRDKVSPMALAAIAAGADGIIVEVHNDPDKALSDGAQSLYPFQFEKLMRDIEVLSCVVGREVSFLPFADRKISKVSEVPSEKNALCAFSGGVGAYAEQAIHHYFEDVKSLPVSSFAEIFQSVLSGKASYGMVPIENSLAGSVHENYDNLFRFQDVYIAGCIKLRIEHSLIGTKNASIGTIENIYSHPQAFAQCRDFLKEHKDWKQIESLSTATAAETIFDLNSEKNACIASGEVTKYFDLQILKKGIESNPKNFTRFFIIKAKKNEAVEDMTGSKASIMFIAKNESGALYNILGVFHKYNFNLVHLESRPIMGEPWKYMFYADMDILSENRDNLKTVLEELKKETSVVRLLGIYDEK